jgi:hypothetical protein
MNFSEKLHSVVAKGFSASKDLANKAGQKANDLATMGAIKVENSQLKSHVDKLQARLGKEVYYKLVDMNKSTVSRENPLISEILEEIKKLHSKIALKEEEYRAIGNKAVAKA